MVEPTLWQRMIECEYNRLCDVALCGRFDWRHKICQGAVVLCSTSAVLMWTWSIANGLPTLVSAIVALCAVTDLMGNFAERSALYAASTLEWCRLKFAFEAAHHREEGGEPIRSDDRDALEEQFRTLCTKQPHALRLEFHAPIMEQVLRSLGYTEDEITSRAWA